MYKLLLILKYLRRRRIAWVSLVAVMLCTTMVLVVISVMGGWLRMFRSSFHSVSGDIIVDGQSMVGFPHYEEMLKGIRALPEVKAAAPVVRTFGLVNIDNQIRKGVEVLGYPSNIGQVNGFMDSLHRKGGNMGGVLVEEKDLATVMAQPDPEKAAAERPAISPSANAYYVITGKRALKLDEESRILARSYLQSKNSTARVRLLAHETPQGGLAVEAFSPADKLTFDLWPDIGYLLPGDFIKGDPKSWGGMIVGSGVIGLKKNEQGQIARSNYMYRAYVDLTVLPMDPKRRAVTQVKPARDFFWIIDDSRTKVYIYDANTVYVPFDKLQEMLEMDGSDGLPPRASDIQISLKPGADLQAAKLKIQQAVDRVADQHQIDIGRYPFEVLTWEEVHKTFIGAIENEKSLVTILFGIISLVAVFLIFCIFYMIVVEKIKDIGIIKSVGATSTGVAGIFLGYGMAIGVVGSMLGLGLGWLIVRYINELHDWLGRFGIVVWNPEVYLFDSIPNTMNPKEDAVIIAIAIIASVLGALVPAIRAARMHPVEALRWE